MVKFGGRNAIAVRVDATKFEGWFYEGAGIYRHVWLDKTAPVAIAPNGVFVWSESKNNVPSGPATVQMRAMGGQPCPDFQNRKPPARIRVAADGFGCMASSQSNPRYIAKCSPSLSTPRQTPLATADGLVPATAVVQTEPCAAVQRAGVTVAMAE